MVTPKRGSPGKPCCGPPAGFDLLIRGCDSRPLPGATVTLVQGGTTVTATTDAAGLAHFAMAATGTWSYTVSATGYVTQTGSVTLPGGIGGGGAFVTLAPDAAAGYFCDCCGNAVTSLSITWTLNFNLYGTLTQTFTTNSGTTTAETPWVLASSGSGIGDWFRLRGVCAATGPLLDFYQTTPGSPTPPTPTTGAASTRSTTLATSGQCSPFSWTYPAGGGSIGGVGNDFGGGTLVH